MQTKKELRTYFIKLREQKGIIDLEKMNKLAIDAFLNYFSDKKETIFACYYPIKNEFNTIELMKKLEDLGNVVSLPTIDKEKKLLFRQWDMESKLVLGSFLIPEPSIQCAEVEPDIIIAPLLVCDKSGHRLGYGKGFYDKYIEHIRKQKKIIYVAICYEYQVIDSLPYEAHDQKLDLIVTDKGVYNVSI
jgi:5-formyltetrahydrofolate cyclo-ligase